MRGDVSFEYFSFPYQYVKYKLSPLFLYSQFVLPGGDFMPLWSFEEVWKDE